MPKALKRFLNTSDVTLYAPKGFSRKFREVSNSESNKEVFFKFGQFGPLSQRFKAKIFINRFVQRDG